jgi:hypothetical protein
VASAAASSPTSRAVTAAAFAESSSWDNVVRKVTGNQHRVIAFAKRW